MQLPIFPLGVTPITAEIAFQCEEGKVCYFNGHLPVFIHEKKELATFRLFTSQLMLIRLFQQTPIYRAQPLLDGVERFAPPRISLYDVGLCPVPRPSKVWNAAMGCLRRLWRKTNSSR